MDCHRDDITLRMTLSVDVVTCLTELCMTHMEPLQYVLLRRPRAKLTLLRPGRRATLTPIRTYIQDGKSPIPLISMVSRQWYPSLHRLSDPQAYESVGLAIINIQHLVPPGRPATSYHIPAAIGTLVGEVPAIAINLVDPRQVRFAYRSTALLRLHYGAVRLVARWAYSDHFLTALTPTCSSQPLPDRWRGQTGMMNVKTSLKTPPKNHTENLSIQRLASLVDYDSKGAPFPNMYRKPCKDSRFQGVTVISSKGNPRKLRDFTYTSVWDKEAPSFSGGNIHFTPQTYPLLSDSSLDALAFVSLPLKQGSKSKVEAWYLAGVGCTFPSHFGEGSRVLTEYGC
jgi:hypothetical protein